MRSYKTFNEQFEQLIEHPRYGGATFEGDDECGRLITLPNVVLPDGWSNRVATLYFWARPMFPFNPPQRFWSNPDLRFADGGVPQRCCGGEIPLKGGPALHWFYSPRVWSINHDTLLTYAHFIRTRFRSLR